MFALRRIAALVLAALVAAGLTGAARGQGAEEELAQKWTPVLRLKEQAEPCGKGEPYEPVDVDVLFGNVDVAFRGPWDNVNLVGIAPTVEQLAQGYLDYHLDFPGDPLDPGCSYEEWGEGLTAESVPTIYAHVAADPAYPGKLVLQYWFFYVFNDFNNKHEGDWEMIQLNFDAGSAEEALALEPTELGYSQHEGAERAEWGAKKLELVDATHPVVYPASGSHANYYTSKIFLGRSAAQGVGCDDTTGPSRELRPQVAVVPTEPDAYLAAFPWLGYEGRWGELQPSFYDGPTGPNLKQQWTNPIAWAEETWRDNSFPLPGGAELLPVATTFFCQAVAAGSSLLTTVTRNPQGGLFLLAALAALLVWVATQTRWTPGAALRLARRRTVGELLTASRRMYGQHVRLYAGIGLIFIPIALLVAGLQAGLFLLTDVGGFADVAGSSNPALAMFVFGLSLIFQLLGLGLVQATVARAMLALDEARPITARGAYREVRHQLRPLAGAVLLITVVVAPLTISFFLIPIGVWILVRWSLTAQAVALEGLRARAALGRSWKLVRGRWWRTAGLVIGVTTVAVVIGPLVGALALLGTGAAFWVANLISATIYVFAFPFVAVLTTYIYYDLRVRKDIEPDYTTTPLPPEQAGTTPEQAS